MASSAVMGCLADELYAKGYHLYGAFLHPLSLARAFNNVSLDLTSRRVTDPMLIKLGDALFPSPFVSDCVERLEGIFNVPFSRINLLYALPSFESLDKTPGAVKLIELITTANERIVLRSNVMGKY